MSDRQVMVMVFMQQHSLSNLYGGVACVFLGTALGSSCPFVASSCEELASLLPSNEYRLTLNWIVAY